MRVTHTTHYLAIYIVSKHEMDATWTLCISLSTRASRALCCPSRVGVGNLLELPAAAVLWCGCRSWLPVIAVTGSSSVATSGATGCCWLCCCLSGVTLARVVGLCWRHFLLGRRSHRADLHNPIDLCLLVRVRCPWGMYSLKPVRRGGMMNSRPWRDAATVACQKSGMYPRFDSAAGLG